VRLLTQSLKYSRFLRRSQLDCLVHDLCVCARGKSHLAENRVAADDQTKQLTLEELDRTHPFVISTDIQRSLRSQHPSSYRESLCTVTLPALDVVATNQECELPGSSSDTSSSRSTFPLHLLSLRPRTRRMTTRWRADKRREGGHMRRSPNSLVMISFIFSR